MADFYQHSRLPTLHHLSSPDPQKQEEQMTHLAEDKPVVLVLPALYAECERPALPAILTEAARIPYVSLVVLSMNGMLPGQEQRVLELCRDTIPKKPLHLLCNDSPEMTANYQMLERGGFGRVMPGKGTNIWTGTLYLESIGYRGIVASHDTDILSYSSQLLMKLCYPLLHPRMPYQFAKGYYSRVAGRLYGRVTRLLIFPLIQAFQEVLGREPLLEHLECFRYPLSGEFAADMSLLTKLTMPSGWGLEVGMLCETYHHLPTANQCQVDLGLHFEHRHRRLGTGNTEIEHGLVVAATEVVRCLTSKVLQGRDEEEATALLNRVLESYQPRAQEWMDRYEHVALLNGLDHDAAEEQAAVAAFVEALKGLRLSAHPDEGNGSVNLPPVNEVIAKLPELKAAMQQVALKP